MQESMSASGQRREIGANFRAAAQRNLNRVGAEKREIPLLPSDPRHPDYKSMPKLGPLPKRDPGAIGIKREPGSFKIPEVQPKAKLAELKTESKSKKSPLLSVEISTKPSVVVENKPLVPTFQEWQNKKEREETVQKFDRATAARDAALNPKVVEILTSVREADSEDIRKQAVLKNKIGSALDAMDAEDERDEHQKKQWADKLTGILDRSKARKEAKDQERKDAEELTALIASQRTPEEVALAGEEERERVSKLNEKFENSSPEAIEEANRIKKEEERQALRARLEAVADAEIARQDLEEEIEKQAQAKLAAKALASDEEEIDVPPEHKLMSRELSGSEIDAQDNLPKSQVSSGPTFEVDQAYSAQAEAEANFKPTAGHSERKILEPFLASRPQAKLETRARGEQKALEEQQILEEKYRTVAEAESAYIVAQKHFNPKKWGEPTEAITDEIRDEILAEPPSFWILNGLKRRTLNTLWKELQDARSKISKEELRRIKTNDFSKNRPSNGVDGIAVDREMMGKAKKKNLKTEARHDAAFKEIMAQELPVEDGLPKIKLGSEVDADNLDNGWFIDEPHYYTEGRERERVDAIVDILIREVDPGSTDEQLMLSGDSRGSELSWDKVYARTEKELGLKSGDLNERVLQDTLLAYARKRGYEDYVKRSEERRKQGFSI